MTPQRVIIAARKCPKCGRDSKVYWSKEKPSGKIIRRRTCLNCGARFETVEVFLRHFYGYKYSDDIDIANP